MADVSLAPPANRRALVAKGLIPAPSLTTRVLGTGDLIFGI
jgi:hypothetical protein